VVAPVGSVVRRGDTVLLLRHRGGRGLGEALTLLADAITLGAAPPAEAPPIRESVS
jgi:hypothetical protein